MIIITKLSYPENGLKSLIYNDIDDALTNMNNASGHYLSSPSFKYSNYLNSLNKTIYNYKKKLLGIKSSIVYVNGLYDNLEDDIEESYKRLSFSTIKERERTIK